jgi:hypothetical protein
LWGSSLLTSTKFTKHRFRGALFLTAEFLEFLWRKFVISRPPPRLFAKERRARGEGEGVEAQARKQRQQQEIKGKYRAKTNATTQAAIQDTQDPGATGDALNAAYNRDFLLRPSIRVQLAADTVWLVLSLTPSLSLFFLLLSSSLMSDWE